MDKELSDHKREKLTGNTHNHIKYQQAFSPDNNKQLGKTSSNQQQTNPKPQPKPKTKTKKQPPSKACSENSCNNKKRKQELQTQNKLLHFCKISCSCSTVKQRMSTIPFNL